MYYEWWLALITMIEYQKVNEFCYVGPQHAAYKINI